MDKYSLAVKSKDSENNEVTRTITYINPEAQPSDLKAMAQGLVALTTNTYASAERIATENVDTAVDKQPLVLTNLQYKIGDEASVSFTLSDLPLTINIADTTFATTKRISMYFQSGATSMSRPLVTRETTVGSVSSPNGMTYWGGGSSWRDMMTFTSDEPQTFTYRIQFAADDTHLAFDTTITIQLVGGE